MTYRVILQPTALRDLQDTACWLRRESKSPGVASQWLKSVRERIRTLETNPFRCPIDPDSDVYGEEVRVLLFGKKQGTYRILFIVRGDTVRVLTVRHSARAEWNPEEIDQP